MTDRADAGFTLLHFIVFLAVAALLAGLGVPLISQLLEIQRTSETEGQLDDLKRAVVGDPEITRRGVRNSFGFVGDMGGVPDSLPQLAHRTGLPAFQVFGANRLAAGWRGPYTILEVEQDTVTTRVDAFGRPLVYRTRDTTVSGEVWNAELRSAGEDGTPDTDDDVVVPILRRETVADTVKGRVFTADGDAVDGTTVNLTFRRDGSLVDTTATTGSDGWYRFTDVPFGFHLARLGVGFASASGIELVPGSVVATETGTEKRVRFKVQNVGEQEVVITSLRAIYDTTAHYRWVTSQDPDENNETELFDAKEDLPKDADWPGSGDVVNFSRPDTLPGFGQVSTEDVTSRVYFAVDRQVVIVPPILQSSSSFTPDSVGTTIRLKEFRRNANGSGRPVDMADRTFTIEFSDGSVITFDTPPSS